MNEKRKYSRVQKSLPLKISGSAHGDIVTETKNISGNGAYCAVNKPLEEMTKLGIILLVPDLRARRKTVKKISCQGVVVRKEYVKNNGTHFYNIGIFFNDITESDRKTLVSYLNHT